ncbi:MAG: Asp23/Gls24 family envelope stress response protein [Lachnospiraceae bacterium]|nr:Asp23/Gls24 family envelope stress response protein [Lachnospiraceae bacterium]
MQGMISTELGNITIDEDVVATYAGSVALGCTGIVGMATLDMRDGLMKLLKKDSIKRGIEVSIEDNVIYLAFHVIVAYGVNIPVVSENLIDSVKYQVEEFTGMKIGRTDVFVEGVRVID